MSGDMQVANNGAKALRKRKEGNQPTQDVKDIDNLKSDTPLNGARGANGGGGADNV